MTDHAKVAEHYAAVLEEIKAPTAHRFTIEVYALDPGTDLATVSFVIDEYHASRIGAASPRLVRTIRNGRPLTVGMWRIVPEEDANV